MKKLLLTLALVAFTGGVASAQGACAGKNTPACVQARNAFAEHHGGAFPGQYFQGRQGTWMRNGNDWRFHGNDGRDYVRGDHGWGWNEAREHHHHHDYDHDHH